jgi:predicted RNase H-like HicB family nuclease
LRLIAGMKFGEELRKETCTLRLLFTRGALKRYTAVVERDPETGLYVGHVPGFPGAHSQAETLDELNVNLSEVIAMLLEDGEPELESEFVGIQTVQVD